MPTFAHEIRKIVSVPCFGRPFICAGRPEECSTLVIGENPASEVGVDWWKFWDDDAGFAYQDWMEAYDRARVKCGAVPVSATRRRLNRLRVHGIVCLETNAFANEGRRNGVGNQANTALIQIALSALPSLRYVIAHGKKAHAVIEAMTMDCLNRIKVFRTRHFRLESYATIDQIACEIRKIDQARAEGCSNVILGGTTNTR